MRIVPVSLRIALGTLIFTLAISFTAVAAGVIMRASTSDSGSQGTSVSIAQEISADGRYVAFTSYANNLVSGDTNGQCDAFVKDRQTGHIVRVSTDSSGAQVAGSCEASISADGRYVAFSNQGKC